MAALHDCEAVALKPGVRRPHHRAGAQQQAGSAQEPRGQTAGLQDSQAQGRTPLAANPRTTVQRTVEFMQTL